MALGQGPDARMLAVDKRDLTLVREEYSTVTVPLDTVALGRVAAKGRWKPRRGHLCASC